MQVLAFLATITSSNFILRRLKYFHLIVMVIFYYLMKYFFAQVIHILILAISFLISIFLLKKVVFNGSTKSQKSAFGIYFLGFVFIVIHIARESVPVAHCA